MALTRKFLSALGIESEKIEEIITAHTDTVNALKEERDTAQEKAAKLTAVQAELEKLKNKPDDGYKARYDDLKAEYEQYKKDVDAEKALTAKKEAYTELCKDAGLSEKGINKAVKYADWSSVELDENGSVKNAKDHIKAIRDEWSEHIMTVVEKGAPTAKPPANMGGKTYKSKEEIYQIKDAAERQQAILDNHELFGI